VWQACERKEMLTGCFFVGNPEEMRSLGRHKRRWVDNIKKDPKEI
jgi:hypothetical protein